MDGHNEPGRGCRIGREGWDGGTVGAGNDEGRDDEGQISSNLKTRQGKFIYIALFRQKAVQSTLQR